MSSSQLKDVKDDIDVREDLVLALPEAAHGASGSDVPAPTSSDEQRADASNNNGDSVELTDQTNFLPTRQVIMVFLGLSIALMCSFLDQTIVATALASIEEDLNGGTIGAWVATSYLLTRLCSLASTPLYGRWSDVFGRKVVMLFALAVFLVFSLACALARTMLQLIVFRAFQGIGGGAIITMTLIIVSDIVSLKERGKFMGINEAIIALSNGVGPILGGVISECTRWVFYLNLPLASLAIVTCVWLLPQKKVHGDMRKKLLQIDYVGSLLTVVSSILLLHVHASVIRGGVSYGWVSAPVLVPLILGVVVYALFVFWEAKMAKFPIVPVFIFRYKTVVGVFIVTLMKYLLYYVPQYLQLVRGMSPTKSSLLLLPFLAPIAFCVFTCGQITARTGHYRYLVIAGYSLWTVAQGLQCTIRQNSSEGKIIGSLLMAGIAAGMTFQTTLLAAQAAVSRQQMAVVTAVRNYLRLFGSCIALGVCSSLINNSLREAAQSVGLSSQQIAILLNDPTSVKNDNAGISDAALKVIIKGYSDGFRGVFYLTVAATGVGWLASVFLIQQHELSRADDKELKEAAKEAQRIKKLEKGQYLQTEWILMQCSAGTLGSWSRLRVREIQKVRSTGRAVACNALRATRNVTQVTVWLASSGGTRGYGTVGVYILAKITPDHFALRSS
ncbi:major facilitator superfamily domain-containing protein [Fomitopsis serialis]|uniref:major facilitator superfamily domain-containing protein n=1 Tax=Fomitopsis serialis TaxID=139415 RepID=UPI002007BACB|nr:major facilitator superfamily domain-containing protein [Neoantrodia serialis]KAH9921048.1 major facilitator superfamily domain-containing protein [Neoantrodia serialis]